MEWILILSINVTEAGQITQAPAVVPGFSSEARCKEAGDEIARRLIHQSGMLAESKGHNRNQNPPYVWSDCLRIQK